MRLTPLAGSYALLRLDPWSPLPEWLSDEPFFSITRTVDELSIVCPDECVPASVAAERGWRALKVDGPLDLALPGILVSLASPLADAKIPIFAISTYDTDYLLVRNATFEAACATLERAGHSID